MKWHTPFPRKTKSLSFIFLSTLPLFLILLLPHPAQTNTPTPIYLPLITTSHPVAPIFQISLTEITDGFTKPLGLAHAHDDRLFIVEQEGIIKIVENNTVRATPFLSITNTVNSNRSERGLLGLAFHPQYQSNGRFFINYTNADGDTVIAEYTVSNADPDLADATSEQILMTIAQPYSNHNGGQLAFGPDSYLYIAVGDGGSANDPQDNAQNPNTLLGTILRLDVDSASPYGIPSGNPYIGDPNGRDEVWSIGWRNPWRFSFDRLTGDMFIGDVGQGQWEEISFEPRGGTAVPNYGWPIYEGSNCYIDDCSDAVTILPIAEYEHINGHCSVTGGYIYRGSAHPALIGNYFFADYCSGTIWRSYPNGDGTWDTAEVFDADFFISSFGEGHDGEIYLFDYFNGKLYTLAP